MSSTTSYNWQATNQSHLAAALNDVRRALQEYVVRVQGDSAAEVIENSHGEELETTAASLNPPPALETLSKAFNLTAFERNILLLCAGVELSSSLAQLCAAAQGNSRLTYPTFSLGLAVFPEAYWNALAPVAPLRHWRLIEVGNGESLTQSRLQIDERILHYLTGISYLDERLKGLVKPVHRQTLFLPPNYEAIAQKISEIWSHSPSISCLPIIQLCGEESTGKDAIAALACAKLGIQLQVIAAADIPASVAEREALARLWQREAILNNSAFLIDCEDVESGQMRVVLAFIEGLEGLLIITSRESLHLHQRPAIRIEVNQLSAQEQQKLWQTALGDFAPELNGQIATLVNQFNLPPAKIQAVSLEVFNDYDGKLDTVSNLWNACRVQARSRLDHLAQRIESHAIWEDLVLPEPQLQILRDLVANVRQRAKVYETWGFARQGSRGLGISALFAGASGTGKTLAAEIMANELRLDLYRIDLSSVVSKYIGETEKNLRRVFDAAETGGAILLFDEADALFGKRSEVKDSHDRYANIEVSYLLQRMEAYRGLAILTNNLKNALDPAFSRRLRFVLQFPFPDLHQRREIWRRIFPADTPTEGLDWDKLAKLNVTGGNVRNIALNAAFLAADADESVQMKHLLRATRSEYAKLEKSLTEAEIGGWV